MYALNFSCEFQVIMQEDKIFCCTSLQPKFSSFDLQVAGSKGFSEFSGIKNTNAVTFGKRSDDLSSVVAAQTAVVGYTSQNFQCY